MVSFAEQVLYKLPKKGPLSRPDGNMGTGWLPATYFGHNVATNSTSSLGFTASRSQEPYDGDQKPRNGVWTRFPT